MGNQCSNENHPRVPSADSTLNADDIKSLGKELKKNNREISDYMVNEKGMDRFKKKLLLLGSGSAGKSTLFRKLRSIHTGGLDKEELEGTRPTIRQNIVMTIIILLQQSQILYDKDANRFADCKVELTQDLENVVDVIIQYSEDDFGNEVTLNFESLASLADAIETVWKMEPIQNLYRRRGTLFSIPDNMDYFLNQVKPIMKVDYIPTEPDHLKTRARTIGMTEYTYEHGKHSFDVYDVGGQRAERRKWIHYFESVHALIFVTALNFYNSVLFEDNKANAMLESVKLFKEVVNNKWFRHSEVILLLNKDDLFCEKLRIDNIPLSICFSKDGGWPEPSEYWTHGHHRDEANLSDEINDANFAQFHDMAIKFIEDIFMKRNENKKKMIYRHVTVATDASHVEKVFWDVQNIVVRENMSNAGLIPTTVPTHINSTSTYSNPAYDLPRDANVPNNVYNAVDPPAAPSADAAPEAPPVEANETDAQDATQNEQNAHSTQNMQGTQNTQNLAASGADAAGAADDAGSGSDGEDGNGGTAAVLATAWKNTETKEVAVNSATPTVEQSEEAPQAPAQQNE